MSQGVLSGFPTCCLGAGLSGTESPFLLCSGGVSGLVLWLSFCASLDLLVVEGLLHLMPKRCRRNEPFTGERFARLSQLLQPERATAEFATFQR